MRFFVVFLSASRSDSTSIWLRRLPFKSFPVHHQPSYHVTLSWFWNLLQITYENEKSRPCDHCRSRCKGREDLPLIHSFTTMWLALLFHIHVLGSWNSVQESAVHTKYMRSFPQYIWATAAKIWISVAVFTSFYFPCHHSRLFSTAFWSLQATLHISSYILHLEHKYLYVGSEALTVVFRRNISPLSSHLYLLLVSCWFLDLFSDLANEGDLFIRNMFIQFYCSVYFSTSKVEATYFSENCYLFQADFSETLFFLLFLRLHLLTLWVKAFRDEILRFASSCLSDLPSRKSTGYSNLLEVLLTKNEKDFLRGLLIRKIHILAPTGRFMA
jgi:hypothetical protein